MTLISPHLVQHLLGLACTSVQLPEMKAAYPAYVDYHVVVNVHLCKEWLWMLSCESSGCEC